MAELTDAVSQGPNGSASQLIQSLYFWIMSNPGPTGFSPTGPGPGPTGSGLTIASLTDAVSQGPAGDASQLIQSLYFWIIGSPGPTGF
ncbi:MAG: hypothetical protein RIB41_12235 [Oceanibaculum nanhaiense]|uniref:hypothetical protein n=1 Tax=Oceanibaculum nanhaiense TaxID=1909734 RepID=UPI0032EED106